MTRPVLVTAAAVAFAFAIVLPRTAVAQSDPKYKERREQLSKELEQTEKALAGVKGERAQVEARLERLIAQTMQDRSQALLLTNEQTALQQLDALLATSQTNLTAQRDRFAGLSGAIGGRSGAILVVLLRADSSQAQTVQSAVVSVDNVSSDPHTYSALASGALARGAVDEVYRAPVIPSDHAIAIQVTVDGRTLSGTAKVPAAQQAVTYVQFSVRNGQVTSTSWAGRGSGQF